VTKICKYLFYQKLSNEVSKLFFFFFSESKAPLAGRRIVDINYFFKQIQENLHTGSFGCNFLDMDFVSEIRVGFLSKFKFKCRMCGIKTLILSEKTEKTGEPTEHLPINEAAVNGTLSIGMIFNYLI